MTFQEEIIARLNLAYNFFADTTDIDYTEGFTAAEIRIMDRDVRKDIWIFPELKKMGY